MSGNDILVLAGFIVACLMAASMGAIFRPGVWYEQLAKPTWRPPNWLFAPVWSVLYLMIAVAGWLVWREAGFAGAAIPLTIYAVQLLLNAAWTPIFFGLHRIGMALAEMGLLWISILATITLFAPIAPLAAWLFVPYLAWVSFAAALNFSIWRRSRPAASRPTADPAPRLQGQD